MAQSEKSEIKGAKGQTKIGSKRTLKKFNNEVQNNDYLKRSLWFVNVCTYIHVFFLLPIKVIYK